MKRKLIPALVCLALLTVLLPALSRPAEAESAPTVNLSFNKDPVRYDESFTMHYSISGGAAPYRDVSGVWEGLENGQWKSSNVVPLEGADGEASYALIPLEMTRVRFTVFGEDARGASFSGSVEAALIGDVEMFGDLTLQENRWEKVEIKCYLPADEAGRGQDVVWESSDPSVVSIDSYSQSTAILRTGKPGMATIHVYAWNRSIHRTAQVTVVEKMPTAITLSDARLSIGTGETKSLTASFTPADTSAQVTWTSSDERVATVDANGSVSGLQAGRAVIAAVTSNGLRAECQVTVSLTRPQSVSLDQSGTAQLAVGQAFELHPSVTPAYATYALTWRSSNTRVATVENGVVKAVGEGAARITVTTDNGKSASLNVRVVDPYKPTGIALNQTGTVSLDIDKTLELAYHLIPETAQSEVTWRSSSDKVATVENGIVTPHREGTVTITVTTAKQHKRATVRVKVVDPYKPTGIALNQTGTVTLDLDKTLELGYNLLPETAQSDVTWRSSNTRVATVENGVVTPHKEGTVTITVTTAKQGRRATVRVKVVDPNKLTALSK